MNDRGLVAAVFDVVWDGAAALAAEGTESSLRRAS